MMSEVGLKQICFPCLQACRKKLLNKQRPKKINRDSCSASPQSCHSFTVTSHWTNTQNSKIKCLIDRKSDRCQKYTACCHIHVLWWRQSDRTLINSYFFLFFWGSSQTFLSFVFFYNYVLTKTSEFAFTSSQIRGPAFTKKEAATWRKNKVPRCAALVRSFFSETSCLMLLKTMLRGRRE